LNFNSYFFSPAFAARSPDYIFYTCRVSGGSQSGPGYINLGWLCF